MVVITLTGWIVIYQLVRRIVAHRYLGIAKVGTLIFAILVEIWLTQDFWILLFVKFST